MRVDARRGGPRDYRVFLDGVEVTAECFLADEERGLVGLYLRDDTGHFYRDTSKREFEAAQEFKHGVVVIQPAAAEPVEPVKESTPA